MSRSRVAVAASTLAVGAVLTACGSGDSSTAALDPGSPTRPGNVLTFTDEHHRTFTISPHDVTCAVGDYGHGVKTLQIKQVDMDQRSILEVQVVPVARQTTYSLPVDGGDEERGRRNAFFFIGSRRFEVSTDEELRHPGRDADGRLTVLEATCDPVRLRMTIDGTLGSEYSDGQELSVTGGVDLTGS